MELFELLHQFIKPIVAVFIYDLINKHTGSALHFSGNPCKLFFAEIFNLGGLLIEENTIDVPHFLLLVAFVAMLLV